MYSRPFLQTIEIGSIINYMYILIEPEQKFGIQSTLQNNWIDKKFQKLTYGLKDRLDFHFSCIPRHFTWLIHPSSFKTLFV